MKIQYLLFTLLVAGMTMTSCGGSDNPPEDNSQIANRNKNTPTASMPTEIIRLEFPHVKGDDGNPVIVHKVDGEVNFALEWDNQKRAQRWTCYQMYASNQTKRWKRSNWKKIDPWFGDPFQVDPAIQPAYQSTDKDHWNDGYDRGHICPSEDRVNSREANMQTFYYSNMQPQLNDFNAGVWETMEQRIRSWITSSSPKSDTLYVCKGGIIEGTQGKDFTYNNRKLIVPGHFFCALLMKNAQGYKAIGFWFEHKPNKDTNLGKYAVNIHELEQLTKLDFFCNLPDDIENKVESLADDSMKRAWGL